MPVQKKLNIDAHLIEKGGRKNLEFEIILTDDLLKEMDEESKKSVLEKAAKGDRVPEKTKENIERSKAPKKKLLKDIKCRVDEKRELRRERRNKT